MTIHGRKSFDTVEHSRFMLWEIDQMITDLDKAGYAVISKEGGSVEATATLALAYEQRTANLIAYAKVADDETADLLWVDHITPRLGLDETP